ncbi:hypothetical protein A3D01_04650 [Candidatus Woesebacteria bacterium RIFCSPHIGHO2_02_FULL_39_13]|uniref:Uncharacterized protein n=1 Tax=Candidatus Woesebacteria bacterium RIFCSPHIGHO2_02_FULL_39_13 TaxID=1802505 RepID=A0A1F7Z0W1_9BACT|nr:MAG: hypothetical protein A3D01_04650 [Candidatus Woesebacteria bacterium RIFCSPHIGHO2_02_FULL_39_13]OGM72214.1 MAG: hypothetical protein A3H19_02160 [Candidatus Woesebacteria bacterium RIFCSPLOWO2_12_FULL_39_9]
MFYLILFFIELISLFFLSRKLHRKLGTFLFSLTRSRKITIYVMAVLFLPGTIVHELSHFLAGLFLLVPVGEIEFIPEFDEEGVKLGSAEIGKTDPIRRFLIGVAPLIVGTVLILLVVYLLSVKSIMGENIWLKRLIIGVMVFELGNTMFLSKKDLEGAWKIYLFLALLVILLYISGLSLSPETMGVISGSKIAIAFEKASVFMLVPLFIDLGFIGSLKLFK